MTTDSILGIHPSNDLGNSLSSSDSKTKKGHQQRDLKEISSATPSLVSVLRTSLVKHHIDPAAQIAKMAALKRLGFSAEQAKIKRFPTHLSTQKGNLAEVFLAEYIADSTDTALPVYRLRYNPNVDQSMKGDDVLAFDLDAEPMRVIVGEAKFRTTSSKAAVEEMVDGLLRSYHSGVPASLQFVADNLYRVHNYELADKVIECQVRLVQGRLQLDYVGLLLSDNNSASRLKQHTNGSLRRLAVISFGVDDPNHLVNTCFNELEDSL